jgi:type IV pilus assembly protein PilZ
MSDKQNALSFSIKDKNALHASYMSFVENGGIFIPTTHDYKMGQPIFLLLNLMIEVERYPVNGKVIWKTPPGSEGYRSAGIGVQFSAQDSLVKNKIENYLAGIIDSDRPTYTM